MKSMVNLYSIVFDEIYIGNTFKVIRWAIASKRKMCLKIEILPFVLA